MPRPDVSDERIPQILSAALKVFNRKGLAAARMEDIACEAKLSIGGVYWYYKGKDEVVLAIMDRVIDEDVAALTSLLNETGRCANACSDTCAPRQRTERNTCRWSMSYMDRHGVIQMCESIFKNTFNITVARLHKLFSREWRAERFAKAMPMPLLRRWSQSMKAHWSWHCWMRRAWMLKRHPYSQLNLFLMEYLHSGIYGSGSRYCYHRRKRRIGIE